MLRKIINYRKRHGLRLLVIKVIMRFFEIIRLKDRPPYEQVQNDFVYLIDKYLNINSDEIQNFFMVGAHTASELPLLRRRFRKAQFVLFEPYPTYFQTIKEKIKSCSRTTAHNIALGDTQGAINFNQTNIEGSGSILEPNSLAKKSYNMAISETLSVKMETVSGFCKSNHLAHPDILWIDVQGFEKQVLDGITNEDFSKIKAIFIEVAAIQPIYNGQTHLYDIQSLLKLHNFYLIGLGTDPINHTGNAIFIKLTE